MRVLSCIPQQQYTMQAKLDWIDRTAKANGPIDLFVLPQEVFGGVQQEFFKTGEPLGYTPEQVLAPIQRLSIAHDMPIAFGAVIDCPDLKQRRERIYIVDPRKGVVGQADKMMLPAYDHFEAKSPIAIVPEHNLENRAQAFEVRGSRVSILFCWEVHSNYLWHAMCRAQPDLVLSMIKFGVSGWPQKGKTENGESFVAGFGFGDDGGWVERLQMAAKYDLACPIVNSTNSWDLPNKANALAGVILPWDEKGGPNYKTRKSSLYRTDALGKGNIVEHVQVDDIDTLYWRLIRDNKYKMNEAIEQWPSAEARAFTMMWKVKRMERQFQGLPTLTAEPPLTRGQRIQASKAAKGKRKPTKAGVNAFGLMG